MKIDPIHLKSELATVRTTEWFPMNRRGAHGPRMPQAVDQPWKGWPMRGVQTLNKVHGTTPLGLVSPACRPGVAGTPGYSGRTPLGFMVAWKAGMGSRGRVGREDHSIRFQSEPPTVRAKMQAYLEELGV